MRGYRRTGIVIGLTVALMWFFLRSADLASVWLHIRRARLDLISAAFGAIVVSYLVRVGRWQRLLAPIAQVGFAPAVRATVIGFATTAVLPGRLGEVLRPYLLARRERLSARSVRLTRAFGGSGASVATAQPAVSNAVRRGGKSDAVWPSAPKPRRTTSQSSSASAVSTTAS